MTPSDRVVSMFFHTLLLKTIDVVSPGISGVRKTTSTLWGCLIHDPVQLSILDIHERVF